MKKTDPPSYTPIEPEKNLNNDIGNRTVDHFIGRSYSILRSNVFEPFSESEELSTLRSRIRCAICNPELQAEIIQGWNSEATHDDQEVRRLLKDAKHACLYLELAIAAEERKEHSKAWAFTTYASLEVGEISARADAILTNIHSKKTSQQNSKNVQWRYKDLLLVHQKAAQLLEEKKPEAGWKTQQDAIDNIENPLADFIKTNSISGIEYENLQDYLKKKLAPQNKIIRDAWEKTRRLQKAK